MIKTSRPIDNPLLSRALAITLLITAIVVLSKWLVQPTIQHFIEQWHKNSQIEESVRRYSMIIANEQAYKDSLNKIQASPLPKIWYNAASVTSLGAQIQNDVRDIIVAAGGSIDSMQSLQAIQENDMTKIGISISMRTDIKKLATILQRLTDHHKLLRADNIIIRAAEKQASIGQPSLSLKWDIVGFGTLTPSQQ